MTRLLAFAIVAAALLVAPTTATAHGPYYRRGPVFSFGLYGAPYPVYRPYYAPYYGYYRPRYFGPPAGYYYPPPVVAPGPVVVPGPVMAPAPVVAPGVSFSIRP